ncbi:translation initiation factor IF-2 [Xylanibacter rodentium]|jgi:translation initiation factor IF-2|uniref:Translation initiation factor IF-2 n=1 Tax=Xylanibacter rodentium TaxID=2736289 RepID=A0ABX2AZS6_9BACT|nr:translation initiation factor IF-2 [Xylanibacter rodentium]NPE10704.1 translation initiation factor IF-2 [Prevotella sp. PJ1A]NPE14912.1 translation initiation factor IF-2 [Xylanibacter rodentium]NPE37335.1 translation initiation factor IF-2 [Prevotella sp. PCJ2]
MAIRLNKVLTELNIGLQTAVEFLKNEKNLGEIKDDANMNTKITDEQYRALVQKFKGDKDVKSEAEKIFAKKTKDKRADKKVTKAEELLEQRPLFKPLGKIDLDNMGKKTSKSSNTETTEPKKQSADIKVEEKKAETTDLQKAKTAEASATNSTVQTQEKSRKEDKPVAEQPQPKAAEARKPEAKQQNEKKSQPKSTEAKQQQTAEQPKTSVETKAESTKPKPAEESGTEKQQASSEPKIFTLKSEAKMAPKVNVLGKIDLDALNQSTRPKKKSKEERRKEREEKAAQQRGGAERKKRVRIGKERVDIEAAAKQTSGQATQNKKNKNGKPGTGNAGPQGNNNHAGDRQNNRKNRKNRNQPAKPLEVNEEDVARQVKETLARLTNKATQNKKGAKYRREKREAVQERLNEEMREEQAESKTLKLTEFVTVSELATMMNVPVNKVIGTCMNLGIMVSINQRLDAETVNIVADEFGFKTEYVSAEVSEAINEEADDESDLLPRAPIVTVMGHVDHGKTSLLDHIRNTNVIAGEAGGITQHIGAYNVTLQDGRQITFLDTPGHEAFTAMRARGAQVTDIAIIIIAADDSVMPTTREAIAHAQAANVPMVFAINKIDKPGANPDKIREDLSQMNLLVEEWGGKYQCQEISAKKGIGVDELLEKVLLEAEMLELKANPNRRASGSIIESSLDKGRGYVSTVLVSNGTLKQGDYVVAGTSYGRIKAMFNERNQRIDKAAPAEPAIILGLNGAPTAGDSFHVMETEQEAKEIAGKRERLQREQGLRTQTRLTLADISHRIALGSFKELNLIVKGDTDGSVEALSDSFIKLSTEKIKVNVIHKAVGQISENDVQLAYASDALIVGFQVRPSASARKLADNEGVEINTYSIIYDAIEDIKSAMEGMLEKIKKEVVTGQVEVRQVFKISKVGTVAGAIVTEGKVHRSDRARVVRDGIVVHTADISALKRYKDDVKEVPTGFECGISLVNFNDILEGDIIETFTEIEVQQKL